MTTSRTTTRAQLLRDLSRAQELLEQGQHQQARDRLETVRVAAAAAGLRSAHLSWSLAAACDYLGDLEAAMAHIVEALDLDSLATPFHRSLEIISGRIRQALSDAGRAANDETTPRLYRLLVQRGEADAGSHLAMARFHRAAGQHDAALRLIEATTLLHPDSVSAWAFRAELALEHGDHEGAAEAQAQAAALGRERLPFALAPRAQG